MRFLLDTNVVSELRRPTPSAAVVEWVARQSVAELAISVITVLELEIGVARIERRDPRQGAALRAWLDDRVVTGFAGRVLAVDVAVVRLAARWHVPDPRPDRDTLIAATAVHHGLVVVTRNVADFRLDGLTVIDPWTG